MARSWFVVHRVAVMGQTKERKEPTERCPAGETGAVEEETRKEWCRGVMSGGLFGRYVIDSGLRFMGSRRDQLRPDQVPVGRAQVATGHGAIGRPLNCCATLDRDRPVFVRPIRNKRGRHLERTA